MTDTRAAQTHAASAPWGRVRGAMRPRRLALSAFIGTLLAAGPAAAQPSCAEPAVTADIDRALDLRRRGHERRALDQLRAVHDRCPSPRTLAQVALAEQGLRRWRDAHAHLSAALAATGDPWITSRRAVLQQSLAEVRERLPAVAPQTNVPGAELRVDGERAGTLPLATPWVIPSGAATLELTAPGYQTLRRAVSLADGEVFREAMNLHPSALPAAPAPPGAVVDAPAPAPDVARSVVGWSAVGVGVVLGGLALWQAVSWSSEGGDAGRATPTSPGALGAWARYQDDVNSLRSLDPDAVCARASGDASPDASAVRELCDGSAQRAALAWGLGVAAAVVAATGAVVLATAPGPAARTSWRVAPWLASDARGAAAVVRW